MPIQISLDAKVLLEKLLNDYGRVGGPSKYGWHTIESSFRCWREYQLAQNEANMPPRRAYALHVGTILHEVLAEYYSKAKVNPQIKAEALLTYLIQNGYEEECTEVRRLFDAYRRNYEDNDSFMSKDVEVLAIEQECIRELPGGLMYSCRWDMVQRRADGVWVVDHKTTAARTTEFTEGWLTEPTIQGQIWCADSLWPDVRGAIINGIIKTKEPGFERTMYARDDRMQHDWMQMMLYKHAEMGFARLNDWPPNFTQCFRKMGPYVGKCRFYERCVYGVDAQENG